MNEQLDRIEAVLADVGGFLLYLQQNYILRGNAHTRAGQHEENVGEALRALMEVKQKLGLPVEMAEEEREAA